MYIEVKLIEQFLPEDENSSTNLLDYKGCDNPEGNSNVNLLI
jgi:hypothetical protein